MDYAESLATVMGREYIYISTEHTELYEKYGYEFYKMETDIEGEDSRVYRKALSVDEPDKDRRYENGAEWKGTLYDKGKCPNINVCQEKGLDGCYECKELKECRKVFFDIEQSVNWKSVECISKGWSSDEKYLITTGTGELLLLRLSDIERYDAKKKEYDIIVKYSKLGIKMSEPIEFGICNDGKNVYMLLTWIEGRDLEEVLPSLSEEEQYKLGRQAGSILKRIHSIPLDENDIPVTTKRSKKLLQLSAYEESHVRIAGDEVAIKYVKDNIDRIWREKPVYMHGDFHPGNLILMSNGSIGVIDFNRWEIGDPYEEFYKLESFGIESSIPYCIGQIDAYFNDDIPKEFWITLAVYVAHASLYSIKWAEKFGQDEIDGMVKRCRRAFVDYNDFKSVIPKWYSAHKS